MPAPDEARDVLVLRQHADRPTRRSLTIGVSIAAVLLAAALLLPLAFGSGPAPSGTPSMRRAAARMQLPPVRPVELVIYDTDVMPIAAAEAVKMNAERPVDIARPRAAAPFVANWQGTADPHRDAAVKCLATAIYYEAASESLEGQRAVAQVVLNRVRHPAFPNSVCGVVYQGSALVTGCQFSFTCDGSLARLPSRAGLARAERVAEEALAGTVAKSVGNATHYHANYVVPYWSPTLDKAATIGTHIFYIMRGSLGRTGAFSVRYDSTLEIIPPTPAAITVDSSLLEGGPASALDGPGLGLPIARPHEDQRAGTLLIPAAPRLRGGTTAPALRADETRGELVVGKIGGLPGGSESGEAQPRPN